MATQQWYIVADDGRVDGPVSAADLQARAAAGAVRPTDRVSPDGVRWATADKVRGLAFGPPAATDTAVLSAAPTARTAPPSLRMPASAPAAPPPLVAPPGYDIERQIGAGACGVVYKARQRAVDRPAAIKTIAVGAADPTMAARFEQEAVTLGRLRHPNIVQVYDAGWVGGRAYLAMEFLDGEDLDRRLDRDGPLPERLAWLLVRQAAAALGHAADQGVIHRDVKPANLFLVRPPSGFGLPVDVPMVKVTDFGLAALDAGPGGQRLTRAGIALGTPAYMAPEQFRTSAVDHRADIYALGATAFHLLTGAPPHAGDTVWDLMAKKVKSSPRLGRGWARESADLLAVMLAPHPDDRVPDYPTLLARIDALPVVRDGPAAPPPPRRRGRRRTARRWAAVAAGLAVGAGLAGWLAVPAEPPAYAVGDVPQAVFDGRGVLGWAADGAAVELARDPEGVPVLKARAVRKPLPPLADYRLTVGVSLDRADAVDVAVAGSPGGPAWVVRLSRADGLTFGPKPLGAADPEPVGRPLPPPPELADPGRYVEVAVVWAGGRVSAAVQGVVVGAADADGPSAGRPELTVVGRGGPFRLESAVVESLVPVAGGR